MNNPLMDLANEMTRRVVAGQDRDVILDWIAPALRNGNGGDDDGWEIRTAADALEIQPPLRYLVHQLIPMGSLGIVYGGPGSLKSMILADLAVCVAGGQRWLEPLDSDYAQPGATFGVEQASVLWIDFDNGKRRTTIRIGAMLRGHGLSADTPIHYVSMPMPQLDASKATEVHRLTALVQRNGYKLIIIDNLGLISGDVDENSAAIGKVLGNFRMLVETTGATVLIVHHQRKGGASTEGTRKGESLRGHSKIESALDLALLIERKTGEDAVSIIPTKIRDYMGNDLLGAHFTYQHVPDSSDLLSARFFSKAALTETETAASQLRSVIQDICRRQPGIVQTDLVTEVRDQLAASVGTAPGINKVRGTIKQMVDDGKLTANSTSGSYRYWMA